MLSVCITAARIKKLSAGWGYCGFTKGIKNDRKNRAALGLDRLNNRAWRKTLSWVCMLDRVWAGA